MNQPAINEFMRRHYSCDHPNFNVILGFYNLIKKYKKSQGMEALSTLKLLGLDFDGTITVKGQVIVREDGCEYIIRSRKDSLLISKVTAAGVRIAVISTEENPVVAVNCKKIKVEYFQGVQTGESKLDILQRKAKELDINQREVAFMGDDINDIPCLEWAGVEVCPSDAHVVVKEIIRQHRAGILLSAEAGNGALRQLTELLLLAKGCDIKR